MINSFIEEYKDRYFKEFNDDFWGNFKRQSQKLLEPKNHPSSELIARLNSLSIFENEPLNVAVVGQFSSGKSTFLNTLLKAELLPTGITPVTAKITTIKYSKFNILKIRYFNGREQILDIFELAKFTDQRDKMEDVESLIIFLNNDVLKDFTIIDTPGLNSRSDNDTNETISLFEKIGAILWISLIDNAARASELKDVISLPKYLKNNSLCVLSQKDRLDKMEQSRVLEHSKIIFKNYFSNVVAISSKLELDGKDDSGFVEVREFLQCLKDKKENIVKAKFTEILQVLLNEREFYVKLYIKLEEILKNGVNDINKKLDEKYQIYKIEFEKIYNWINEISSNISNVFETCVEVIESNYFKESKNMLFSKNKYKKVEYKSPKFNKEFALSKLIYNDDKLLVSFRVFRSKLNEFEKNILDELNTSYKTLENQILLFKGRFESMKKSENICSDVENEVAIKVVSEVYELFLKKYEKSFFVIMQSIKLFFEKIDIKVFTNYENAIKLSANLVEDRVLKSIEDYESDPLTFSLFYPKFEDFKLALLKNLNYYEFEDDFIGNKTFIQKSFNLLKEELKINLAKDLRHINFLKQRHEEIFLELKISLFD